MRNDVHDDDVPSLRADPDEERLARGGRRRGSESFERLAPEPTEYRREPRRGAGTGPLWALVGALVIALAGVAWWGYQQVGLLERQLVATQDSFARISEEAAGRLRDINGQLVASQSSGSTDREALGVRVQKLERLVGQMSDITQTQQATLAAQGKQLDSLSRSIATQGKQVESTVATLASLQDAQRSRQGDLDAQLRTVSDTQAAVRKLQADAGKLSDEVKSLSDKVAAGPKQPDQSRALAEMQDDLLILRTQMDNQLSSNNERAFDAFRIQTTRDINTLRTQIQNLAAGRQ